MKILLSLVLLLGLTSVGAAALPPEAVLPKERFIVNWEGETWLKASDKTDSDGLVTLREYIRQSDRLKGWRELVTDQAVVMRVAQAKVAVEAQFQGLRRRLAGFEGRIIADTPEKVIYEWWQSDPSGYGPEHVIGVAYWRPYSVHFFTYAKKGPKLSEEARALWLKRVTEAAYR